ncbi:MAG: serine hydrolase [Candidatus Latescibacterota bacterium]|nr:MAG: serine hydrolase [Candidatus Latescibacterota bacterium]
MKKPTRILVGLSLTVLVVAGVCSCGRQDDTVAPPTNGTGFSLIDTTYLDSLLTAIENDVYGEVHSVLIHRRDSLVFEHYFNGYFRERLHPVYSVTKSVTSALIGIAIDRGEIADVDEEMLGFFPDHGAIANLDSLKESITLKHLLTMTAGFEWDEWSLPYDHPENDVSRMYVSSDWVSYVLDLPMTDVPGTRFVYNSGVSMLLSAILTNVTGLSARDYAISHLFGRLGVTSWSWDPAPRNPGMSIGGWGLRLRPIDMVEFGRLYLQKGKWGEEQIVSREWVEFSTQPHATISDRTNYGYQWWMYSDFIVEEGLVEVNDIFIAVGRGGQYIWVVPQYELVVVSTAWNDNNGKSSSPMFFRYIIPAVQAADAARGPRYGPRKVPVRFPSWSP